MNVGAMNADDILMADLHERARFVKEAGPVRQVRLQELQRHRVVEPHVTCVEHFSERALPDLLHQEQVAPLRSLPDADLSIRIDLSIRSRRVGRITCPRGRLVVFSGRRSMDRGDARKQAQIMQQAPERFILSRLILEPLPIDGFAIGDRLDELLESSGVIAHRYPVEWADFNSTVLREFQSTPTGVHKRAWRVRGEKRADEQTQTS
jgi:hypothetical protein